MNLRRDEDYKMDRLVGVFDGEYQAPRTSNGGSANAYTDGWEAWASYMAAEEEDGQDVEADEDQPSPKKSRKKDAHSHGHAGHKHH